MIILTIILLALLLAAWKAPKWVKELGLVAPVIGALSFLLSFFAVARHEDIAAAGYITPAVFLIGFSIMFTPLFYRLLIYLISLIIRIIQKPRI